MHSGAAQATTASKHAALLIFAAPLPTLKTAAAARSHECEGHIHQARGRTGVYTRAATPLQRALLCLRVVRVVEAAAKRSAQVLRRSGKVINNTGVQAPRGTQARELVRRAWSQGLCLCRYLLIAAAGTYIRTFTRSFFISSGLRKRHIQYYVRKRNTMCANAWSGCLRIVGEQVQRTVCSSKLARTSLEPQRF